MANLELFELTEFALASFEISESAGLELNSFEMSIRQLEVILWAISRLIPSALRGNMNIEAGPDLAGAGHKVAAVNLELNGLEVILRGIPHLIPSTLSGKINAHTNFKMPSNFDFAGPDSAGLEPACAGHRTT